MSKKKKPYVSGSQLTLLPCLQADCPGTIWRRNLQWAARAAALEMNEGDVEAGDEFDADEELGDHVADELFCETCDTIHSERELVAAYGKQVPR